MDRNARIICLAALFLCAAIGVTTYYGFNYISVLKGNLEILTDEYNGLQQETAAMVQKKRVYENAFKELDKLKAGVGENVDFYSEAQRAIRRGGARVLSNAPNPPKDGRISMKMSFAGDYYSVMRALAEVRGLPNVVRVVALDLSSAAPDTSGNSEIKADVVFEALAYK